MSEMLYQLCPVCKGEGSIQLLKKKQTCPVCKPLRVVETGLTVRQVEAALAKARRHEAPDSPEPPAEAQAPDAASA